MTRKVIHIQTMGDRSGSTERRSPVVELERCPTLGKRSFQSEDDALAAGFDFATQNDYRVSSESAFRCKHCNRWHLTSRRMRK